MLTVPVLPSPFSLFGSETAGRDKPTLALQPPPKKNQFALLSLKPRPRKLIEGAIREMTVVVGIAKIRVLRAKD